MSSLLLLFISILPVYLVGRYVYRKDKSREPIGLVMKLFFGGLGAFGMTIILSLILGLFFPSILSDSFDGDLIGLFFKVFFGVALVEEFSKWFFVYKLSYNSPEFDQIYDMVVYAVFVALGFACIENIFYVFEHGFGVGVIRGLLAVPGHACDGVFMGYYLSMTKVSELKNERESIGNYKLLSLLVPVLLHGFYDYCLFSQSYLFIGLFFVFIVCLYVIVIGKLRSLSKITGKIKYKNNFCGFCGRPVDSDYCPNCGGKNE